MLPPAPCKMNPWDAIEFSCFVVLSVMVGGLCAHWAVLSWRRLRTLRLDELDRSLR